MYYTEIERLKYIKRMLEKLAYGSIALDFLVAVGSLLLLHNFSYAKLIVTISNYAITAEIIIAAVLMVALLSLKHYNKLINNLDFNRFVIRQKRRSKIQYQSKNFEKTSGL